MVLDLFVNGRKEVGEQSNRPLVILRLDANVVSYLCTRNLHTYKQAFFTRILRAECLEGQL